MTLRFVTGFFFVVALGACGGPTGGKVMAEHPVVQWNAPDPEELAGEEDEEEPEEAEEAEADDGKEAKPAKGGKKGGE